MLRNNSKKGIHGSAALFQFFSFHQHTNWGGENLLSHTRVLRAANQTNILSFPIQSISCHCNARHCAGACFRSGTTMADTGPKEVKSSYDRSPLSALVLENTTNEAAALTPVNSSGAFCPLSLPGAIIPLVIVRNNSQPSRDFSLQYDQSSENTSRQHWSSNPETFETPAAAEASRGRPHLPLIPTVASLTGDPTNSHQRPTLRRKYVPRGNYTHFMDGWTSPVGHRGSGSPDLDDGTNTDSDDEEVASLNARVRDTFTLQRADSG